LQLQSFYLVGLSNLIEDNSLQHLIDTGVIRFYWETCEGTHYFYTATGLGIMASGDSITAAITNAIENLECQYQVYTSYPTAPQDVEEKERVLLAHNVYKSSPEEFKRLLGLNITGGYKNAN
jgi:hypothetical protein